MDQNSPREFFFESLKKYIIVERSIIFVRAESDSTNWCSVFFWTVYNVEESLCKSESSVCYLVFYFLISSLLDYCTNFTV